MTRYVRLQTVVRETLVLVKLLAFSLLLLMAWAIAHHENSLGHALKMETAAPPACIRPVLALKNTYNSKKEASC